MCANVRSTARAALTLPVLIAAALIAATLPVRAQQAQTHVRVQPEQRETAGADLKSYEGLVTAYLEGDATAAERLLDWTPKQLAVVLELLSGPGGRLPLWRPQRLAAAAFMHTDAVLSHIAAPSSEAAKAPPTNVPRTISSQKPTLMVHLDVAGRLLALGSPTLDPIARRWYVVVGRVLRDRYLVAQEEELLALGRGRIPGDPTILCESGTLAEYLASGRRVGRFRLQAGDTFTESVRRFRAQRSKNLSDAAGWLAQAADNGADVLCRLHLARVWSLRDDDRARLLLGALQRYDDDAVSYLASMFLGAWAERRNDRSEAERQYRKAIGRFPLGQAASVALGAVLLASGRAGEARELLLPAIVDPSADRREPWWWYHFEPSVVVDGRYESLKKDALR